MGEVVHLQSFAEARSPISRVSRADALVPVEFATGISDREAAIARLAYFGINNLKHRILKDNPSTSLCMVTLADAIRMNKKILELEELSIEDISVRVDLIQMLENIDIATMNTLWRSITAEFEGPTQI